VQTKTITQCHRHHQYNGTMATLFGWFNILISIGWLKPKEQAGTTIRKDEIEQGKKKRT